MSSNGMITKIEITPPPDTSSVWSVRYINDQNQYDTISYGSFKTLIGALTDVNTDIIEPSLKYGTTKNPNK